MTPSPVPLLFDLNIVYSQTVTYISPDVGQIWADTDVVWAGTLRVTLKLSVHKTFFFTLNQSLSIALHFSFVILKGVLFQDSLPKSLRT